MNSPVKSSRTAAGLSFIPPQLATTVDKPPSGTGWIHELRVDGWRIQVIVEQRKARVMTRRGVDWTRRFKEIAEAAGVLPCQAAIIDGEAVVQGERGVSSPDAPAGRERPPVLVAFDLLHLNGEDLRGLPLAERRDRLADLLFGLEGPIGYSEGFTGPWERLLPATEEMGLEGIVSKKADSRYQSGPSKTWLKARLWDEGVFTLIGFEVDPDGEPIPLLAREHAGLFTFAGAARTGLPDEVGDRVATLMPIARAPVSGTGRMNATWLEPVVRVKVRHRHGEAGTDLSHASVTGLAKVGG